MGEEDLYCVTCGQSLLGRVDPVCPVRRFRYNPAARHWHEQPAGDAYYFACAHCGSRLDEDAQDYLLDCIVPEEPSWDPGWDA
jgi:hypothetical protein